MTKQTTTEAAEAASRAVADEVRVEMARQRKTAADLALVLGVTQHTAGKRLNGQSSFTFAELAAAAEWLGLTVSALAARAERVSTVVAS